MIRFNCTHCKQRYKTDDDLAGDDIDCRNCGTTVKIPEVVPPTEEITLTLKKTGVELKKPALAVPTLKLSNPVKAKTLNQTPHTVSFQ